MQCFLVLRRVTIRGKHIFTNVSAPPIAQWGGRHPGSFVIALDESYGRRKLIFIECKRKNVTLISQKSSFVIYFLEKC